MNACNPNIQEVEARELQLWGQLGLHGEFQASLGLTLFSKKTQKRVKRKDKKKQTKNI
jgi:coproporphyrinogen III oxidase-like Fe-S oxidoreductase